MWCPGELRQFCANFQRADTEAQEQAGRIAGSEFKLVVLYEAAADLKFTGLTQNLGQL